MAIASYIDHTLLRPDTTSGAVKALCKEAQEHQFAAVCIPPFFVSNAVAQLKKTSVKIATVIGYPMGYATTPAKVEEIKRALSDGAQEVDVVINICAVKDQNWNYVQNDIDSMCTAVRLKGKTIKVIIETGLLTEAEMIKLCEICNESEPNFVKTSTGINGHGARVEDVALLRKHLKKTIKIKASGGIRSAQDVRQLIDAGAERIGSSTGVAIVNG
ncbi:MAG: deoxyribose-phosphate aldolase [Bacteroidota bacterium]